MKRTRPLLITDCDEVLVHMVSHFDAWLGEVHDIRFAFETGSFGEAMTHNGTGEPVAQDRVWPLLEEFFRLEMHRQTIVPGAVEALGRIGEIAIYNTALTGTDLTDATDYFVDKWLTPAAAGYPTLYYAQQRSR